MLKMKSLSNNVKLVQGIIALWLMAFISTLAIGTIGYLSMKKIQGNLSHVTDNIIVNMRAISDINSNFSNSRTNFTKIMDRSFDNNVLLGITDSDKNIRDLVNVFKKSSAEDEKQLLNNFLDVYEKYMDKLPEIKEKRMNKEAISDEYIYENDKLGNNVLIAIKNLTELEKRKANNVTMQSELNYSRTSEMFIGIFVVTLIVLSFVSLMLIFSIKESIKEFCRLLKIISSGDFTLKIDGSGKNEFSFMRRELSRTIASIYLILKEIKSNSNEINKQAEELTLISKKMAASSEEVNNTIQNVACGSESQAQELMNMNSVVSDYSESMKELINSVEGASDKANSINSVAASSNNKLVDLGNSVEQIEKSFGSVNIQIESLKKSINKINEITVLINSIAGQTNLLALNASIEAARAGESGKGFAVVANEIKKLSERSKEASGEINKLLYVIEDETKAAVDTTKDASNELYAQNEIIEGSIDSFKSIIHWTKQIIPAVLAVSTGIKKFNSMYQILNDKTAGISSVAEENSAASEEISKFSGEIRNSSENVSEAAHHLSNMAVQMAGSVNRFKL